METEKRRVFSIQKDTLKYEQAFKVHWEQQVIDKALHFITPKELFSLRNWMKKNRRQGDIWKTGWRPFKEGEPRFQVEYHGERDLKDLIPLAYPGEYLCFSRNTMCRGTMLAGEII